MALAGTELEFIVFEDTYEQAWDRRYHGLTGANRYNVDYSILGGTRVEPLLRDIRNEMYAARRRPSRAPRASATSASTRSPSSTTRSCAPATTTSVYKTAAKEIAAQHGQSLTFMAKFDEREGNSCHIHLSLRGTDGEIVFADDEPRGWAQRALRPLPRRHPGDDARAHLLLRAEHQLLQAVPARVVRARRRSPGAPTTAPARCGSSATAPACASRTGCPVAT